MKIGVMGAMREEIDGLLKKLKNASSVEIGERTYSTGLLEGKDVVLVFSRWGKVASASTVTTLINHFDVDFVLFAGVAGAVKLDLQIGDIVVADRLVQHDMDASALPMFKKFEIPLSGDIFFPVQSKHVALARQCAEDFLASEFSTVISPSLAREFHMEQPRVVTGLVASGDQFITSAQKVESMRQELPNLQCLEMEGGAVAQVCHEHGVPFIVVRIISDKADHSAVVNFPKFVSQAASQMSGGISLKILSRLAG